jgi:hypothetical protein
MNDIEARRALVEIAELEGDADNQNFKLTRFQAAQIARRALSAYTTPPVSESQDVRETALGIKFPFPCGCQKRHSAPNGFTADAHTCDTHLAIAALVQQQVGLETKRILSIISAEDVVEAIWRLDDDDISVADWHSKVSAIVSTALTAAEAKGDKAGWEHGRNDAAKVAADDILPESIRAIHEYARGRYEGAKAISEGIAALEYKPAALSAEPSASDDQN